MLNSSKIKGLAMGFTATCFWVSFYPVSRYLFGKDEDSFDPFFATFLRILLAALILLPFALTGERHEKTLQAMKKDWKKLLFLSLVGIVGEGLLIFLSLKYTTAARASLMANTSPIYTVILAFFFLKNPVTWEKIVGMFAGFSGIILISVSRTGGDVFSQNASFFLGDMLAMGSGIAWSLFTVFGERIAREYGGMVCMALQFFFGIFLMIPVMFIFQSHISFDFPLRVWIGIIYLGVFGCGIANMLWYSALRYLKSDELGSFGYISAFLSVCMAVICLHERITSVFIVSACLILGGVWLMIRQPKTRTETV